MFGRLYYTPSFVSFFYPFLHPFFILSHASLHLHQRGRMNTIWVGLKLYRQLCTVILLILNTNSVHCSFYPCTPLGLVFNASAKRTDLLSSRGRRVFTYVTCRSTAESLSWSNSGSQTRKMLGVFTIRSCCLPSFFVSYS